MPNVEISDFSDMYQVAQEIYNLMVEKGKLEIKIRDNEANITRTMQNDPSFFLRGKSPSQAHIDNTFKYTGFNNELLSVRLDLVDIEAKLELAKNRFWLMKLAVDVWRTESANERKMVL